MNLLALALGGALGAVSRYGVGQLLTASGVAHLHVATFSVNVVGAFFMGFLFVAFQRLEAPEALHMGLTVGFLGAFTTFSAFSLELLSDVQEGHLVRAALYASLSVLICLISCMLGFSFARSIVD
jgi:CrcB protein